MASGQATIGVGRAIRTVWTAGAVGLLTDAQLLARFGDRTGDGAESAFAALVGRHGPMVLRVGRDVLGDPHRAQDVFQATFTILARKAGSIRQPEALGPWLHGVALRVARKARTEANRRRNHEREAAQRQSTRSAPAVASPDDFTPILHDEVARLSEGCRSAVVLCYFQGLTYDQAADHLGVTEAAVRGRLARARATLRGRLIRRGLAGPTPTLAAIPSLAIPDRLIALTARSAWRVAMGQESTPAAVAGLVNGVTRIMFLAQIKTAAVLVACQLALAAGVLARSGGSESPPEPTPGVVRNAAIRAEMIRQPEEAELARLALTLETALDRLVREVPALSPDRFEIPRARADTLTASLRVNTRYYADGQLIPYGTYIRSRPGGQTRYYEVNVSAPFDLSAKRRARLASATAAQGVTEAQYLDAVRLQVDRLALAFVAALAARDRLQIDRDSADRLARLAKSNQGRALGPADSGRLVLASSVASDATDEARRTLAQTLRALASVLNLPDGEADRLDVVGELTGAMILPTPEVLTAEARTCRPDLAASRLGIGRAQADFRLVLVLMKELGSPSVPALGVTVPLENDRARVNVTQSQTQHEALGRQVAEEVRRAWDECDRARVVAQEAESAAGETRKLRDRAANDFSEDGRNLAGLIAIFSRGDEAERHRVEAVGSLWRAQVALNTAVGRRVLP